MKLSDIMGAMALSTYAEIALVIFFAIFVGVLIHIFRRDLRPEFERAGHLPLEDDFRPEPGDAKENG